MAKINLLAKNTLLHIFLLAGLYVIVGQASFSLDTYNSIKVLTVCTTEGLALAAVILWGRNLWLGIFVGQLLLALYNDFTWTVALGSAVINSLEAIIGATLFYRQNLQSSLTKIRDLTGLLLIIFFVLQPFNTTLNILLLWSNDFIFTHQLALFWLFWWLTHGLGQILIAPLLLSFVTHFNTFKQSLHSFIWLILLVIPIGLISLLPITNTYLSSIIILTIPLLVMFAIKGGINLVTLATLIVTSTILFFSQQLIADDLILGNNSLLLSLNIHLLALVLIGQFTAVALAEYKQMQLALQQTSEQLKEITDYFPSAICQYRINLDDSVQFLYANAGIQSIFQVTPEQTKADANTLFSVLHPDDRNKFFDSMLESAKNVTPWQLNYRVRFADNTIRWLSSYSVPYQSNNSTLWYSFITDITQPKFCEQKIRFLFETASIGFALTDLKTGKVIEINEALYQNTGYSKEEFLALNHWDLIPPEQMAEERDYFELLYKDHRYGPYEKYYLRKDGSRYTVLVNSVLMYDETNREIICSVIENMTERKVMENSLKDSEAFISATLNSLTAHIAVLNAEGDIIMVNQAWQEFAEHNGGSSSMLGVNYLAICEQALEQEYDEEIAKILHGITLVLNDILPYFHAEYSAHSPTELRWFYMTVSPLQDQNGGAVISHKNITKQKLTERALQASEERFRTIIDISPIPMALHDEHGTIMFINSAFQQAFGYELNDIPYLSSWFKLAYPNPDYQQHVIKIWQQHSEIAEQQQKPFIPIELKVHCKNNTQKIVLATTSQALNQLHVVILYDITERKQAEYDLQQLSRLQQMLMEIASTYINLPLNKVHTTIQDSLSKMGRFVNADRAYIVNYDFEKQISINTYEWCAENITPHINELQAVSLTGLNDLIEQHCRGEAIHITDVSALPIDSELHTILTKQDIKSLLTVPLMRTNQCIGFVGFDSVRQHRIYSNNEQHLLTIFAQMLVNIDQRKQTEMELNIAATVFNAQEGMYITNSDSSILKVNQAFTQITGYAADEVIGKTPRLFRSGRHDKAFYNALWQSIEKIGTWQGEIWNKRKNGEIYPQWLTITAVKTDSIQISHYVATLTDITERKMTEQYIEQLAFYDPLTQLPNRRLLQERLKHCIEICHRTNSKMAVLMMDLDKFKAVNDNLGHAAGDELLQQVSKRIKDRLREMDMVARLGGDEFIVLMEQLEYEDHAADLASEIVNILCQPFTLQERHQAYIGTSIGIAIYPEHGDSIEALMDNADAALYDAKDQGRGCFAYFSEQLTQKARERIALENRLRQAIEQQELELYLQPQIDMKNNQIVGAEVLVRWNDPIKGCLMPDSFINLAEETGLIIALGEWVLTEACRLGRQWIDDGLPTIILAVNVSPYQFRRCDMNKLVSQTLLETGFPAQYLELEITESGLMNNQQDALSILNSLHAQGIRIAIDDFGTGYSSLAYLKYFPVDVLKIDKTFIDDIPESEGDMAIASTIIAIAHHLSFKVLAEGVETSEQLAFLQQHGCDRYQGYLYSKPLTANDFAILLASSA